MWGVGRPLKSNVDGQAGAKPGGIPDAIEGYSPVAPGLLPPVCLMRPTQRVALLKTVE